MIIGADLLQLARVEDRAELQDFLQDVDLTTSGLDAATLQVWIARDAGGAIHASTGIELGDDGCHALIRSVAVRADVRGSGMGGRLAEFALDQARLGGARRAWLFSRRSGPFWQRLGFAAADRRELARLLRSTHQVQQFIRTGQLDQEVAWSRLL